MLNPLREKKMEIRAVLKILIAETGKERKEVEAEALHPLTDVILQLCY